MHLALFAVRCLLAAVFLISGTAKLVERSGWDDAVREFGVPSALVRPVAALLPVLEAVLSLLLLLTGTVRIGAIGALILLLAFIVGMIANLARGRAPDCHCFGQLHSEPVSGRTIVRNVVLAVAAAWLALFASSQGTLRLVEGGAALSAEGETVATAVVVLLLVQGWLLLQGSTGRSHVASDVPVVTSPPSLQPLAPSEQPGRPVGAVAPAFAAPTLDGRDVGLADLLASGRPVFLFFLSPHCKPCAELVPEAERWTEQYGDRVRVVAASSGDVVENRAKLGSSRIHTVMLQADREIEELYGVQGTPSAVLITADGRIGSPLALGQQSVQGLMGQVADLVAVSEPPPPALGLGSALPDLSLRLIGGGEVRLREMVRGETLVIFWSSECGFCVDMLPRLRTWVEEKGATPPDVLLIASGIEEQLRAMTEWIPVLLDPERDVATQVGAYGTPTAIAVAADGTISSSVSEGADEVLALGRGLAFLQQRALT